MQSESLRRSSLAGDKEGEREGFVLRPPQKFPRSEAKSRVERVVTELLHDKIYDSGELQKWSNEVADRVRSELAELKLPRYKYIVQVSIGEQRGQGLTISGGVSWDTDTDFTINFMYNRDTFFCQVTLCAIYSY